MGGSPSFTALPDDTCNIALRTSCDFVRFHCFIFFLVELALVLIELVLNSQEHHPPFHDGVVVILLHHSLGVEILGIITVEEVKVGSEVVVLDLQYAEPSLSLPAVR